jgi:hypothetical protein
LFFTGLCENWRARIRLSALQHIKFQQKIAENYKWLLTGINNGVSFPEPMYMASVNFFSSVCAWSSIGKGRFVGVQLLINDLEFWHKMVTKKGHQNFLGLLMYYTLDKEIQENICILRGRLLFLFLENNHFFYKNNHFINIASVCYRFLK